MTEKNSYDDLVKAEENAQIMIQQAQKERERKVKESKFSAEQDISKYKKSKEEIFQQEILQVNIQQQRQNLFNQSSAVNSQTQDEILNINEKFLKNRNLAVDFLMERSLDVTIQIPKVMKQDFENHFKN